MNFQMETGKIVWYDRKKGYGFIAGPDGSDIFIHHSSLASDCPKELDEGDLVSFDAVDGERGPKAQNVHLVQRH